MKPLLRRTKLLPGESLPSLIERLTLLNYYKSGTIDALCYTRGNKQGRMDDVSQPKSAQTFLQLAHLTLISPEDLFAASKHCFAQMFYYPESAKTLITWVDGQHKQLINRGIAHYRLRPSYAAQFCPWCLQAAPHYHRLAWMPFASTVCLQHQCLLLEQCPTCFKKVTVAEIVRTQCKVCKTDLRLSPSISASAHEGGILSQQVMQFWLSLAPFLKT